VPEVTTKPIKFSLERWQDIKALRDLLAAERANDNLSLPDVVNEAVKYYRESLKAKP
jgi:hypothetical protein